MLQRKLFFDPVVVPTRTHAEFHYFQCGDREYSSLIFCGLVNARGWYGRTIPGVKMSTFAPSSFGLGTERTNGDDVRVEPLSFDGAFVPLRPHASRVASASGELNITLCSWLLHHLLVFRLYKTILRPIIASYSQT